MSARDEPHCPRCGQTITRSLDDHGDFQCSRCEMTFRVLLDAKTESTVLIEPRPAVPLPEPLFMPRGSVRAVVALAVSIAAWTIIFSGGEVPSYVFGLLLTVMVYYFGLSGIRGSDRMHDPFAMLEQSSAPGVRGLLIVGFVAAAAFLALTGGGRLAQPKYLEFFVILLGLLAGRGYNSMVRTMPPGTRGIARHGKAVAVLIASVLLALLLLSGYHANLPPLAMIGLCAVVSFYFGSR